MGCRPNPLGALLWETRIGALSSACGRRARFANAQALLAISAMLNPAQRAHGCNPQIPAGNTVPCTLSPLRGETQNETTQSKVIERFHFSIWKDDLTRRTLYHQIRIICAFVYFTSASGWRPIQIPYPHCSNRSSSHNSIPSRYIHYRPAHRPCRPD